MDNLTPSLSDKELVKAIRELQLAVKRLQSLVDVDEVRIRKIEDVLREIQDQEIVPGRPDDSNVFHDDRQIGVVGDGGVVTSSTNALATSLIEEAQEAVISVADLRATIISEESLCAKIYLEDVHEHKAVAHRAVEDRKRDLLSIVNKALAFGRRAITTVGKLVGVGGAIASIIQPELAPIAAGVEILLNSASGLVGLGEELSKSVHPLKAAHGYGETAVKLLNNPKFDDDNRALIARAVDIVWASHLGALGDPNTSIIVDGQPSYPVLTAYGSPNMLYILITERLVNNQIEEITLNIKGNGDVTVLSEVPFYEKLDDKPRHSGVSAMHVLQVRALMNRVGVLSLPLSPDKLYMEMLTFLEHGTRLPFLSDIDASVPFFTLPNPTLPLLPATQAVLANARSLLGV